MITATVTLCRKGQPLIVLDQAPFNGLEIRPAALRELAQDLASFADIAARITQPGKGFEPTVITIKKGEAA